MSIKEAQELYDNLFIRHTNNGGYNQPTFHDKEKAVTFIRKHVTNTKINNKSDLSVIVRALVSYGVNKKNNVNGGGRRTRRAKRSSRRTRHAKRQ